MAEIMAYETAPSLPTTAPVAMPALLNPINIIMIDVKNTARLNPSKIPIIILKKTQRNL